MTNYGSTATISPANALKKNLVSWLCPYKTTNAQYHMAYFLLEFRILIIKLEIMAAYKEKNLVF